MAILERVFPATPLTAEQQKMLRRYHQFREASKRLNNRLSRMLPKGAIRQSAKDLGMLVRGTIVFRHLHESDILTDYALHNYRPSPSAQSLVERFASARFDREAETLDKDEAAIRRHKAAARFAILQVRQVLPGLGIRADDLLWCKQALLLIDVGLSRTAQTRADLRPPIHRRWRWRGRCVGSHAAGFPRQPGTPAGPGNDVILGRHLHRASPGAPRRTGPAAP
jgi:hypothetical protein